MTEVLPPLSVQPASSVPPAVVPIAYQYLTMPLCASAPAVQLADSWVMSQVAEISAPVPSFTVPGAEGAVVSAVCPSELAAGPCTPTPFSALTVK